MSTSDDVAALTAAADELALVLDQESRALNDAEPPEVLASIVRAKALLADRFLAARRRLAAQPLDADMARPARDALDRLLPLMESNAALVRRRLDLVQGLVGAIEAETRRSSGRYVAIYHAGGESLEQQPSPVAIDREL